MLRNLILISVLFFSLAVPCVIYATSYNVDIVAIVEGCGDQVIQSGEQCDGVNLGGTSCVLQGFSYGTLSCSSVCTLNTSACVLDNVFDNPVNESTQVTVNEPLIKNNNVVISGYYKPNGLISVLKDGVLSGVVFADDSGFWQITLSGLNPRTYIFQVLGNTLGNLKVNSDIFVVQVVNDATVKVSNIVLPPEFLISEINDDVVIKGRTVPGANIKILIDNNLNQELTVDSGGEFNAVLDYPFSENEHFVSVELSYGGTWIISKPLKFKLNAEPTELNTCEILVDVTSDCRVSFVDFSVMLRSYFYEPVRVIFDFNKNGRIDLVDFSILAYFWTG